MTHKQQLKQCFKQIIETANNQGVSRYELAKRSGMANTYLYQLINDKDRAPTFKVMERLAEAIDMEINIKVELKPKENVQS